MRINYVQTLNSGDGRAGKLDEEGVEVVDGERKREAIRKCCAVKNSFVLHAIFFFFLSCPFSRTQLVGLLLVPRRRFSRFRSVEFRRVPDDFPCCKNNITRRPERRV